MFWAEILAQKAHAAVFALFRSHPIALYFNKNPHGTEIHALVDGPAVMRPSAQIRIDVYFKTNGCCGSDFHENPLEPDMGTLAIPVPDFFGSYLIFYYKSVTFLSRFIPEKISVHTGNFASVRAPAPVMAVPPSLHCGTPGEKAARTGRHGVSPQPAGRL